MGETGRYGWWTLKELADGRGPDSRANLGLVCILARDLMQAQRELDVERQTGGPCAVCAGSGKLLTDERCRVCSGTGHAHEERQGLRELALKLEQRVAELERLADERWAPGSPEHLRLWDAINRYVKACRGDPSKYVYGNTPRQRAGGDVESAVRVLALGVEPEGGK